MKKKGHRHLKCAFNWLKCYVLMCHYYKMKREMSRLSHCYHIFGPGLLLNWKVPATGCCNIPAASLRRSIYHRGWDISTLFILLNPFKSIKHSPNAYLRLEMNVCNSQVVVSPFDFFFSLFNCSPFGRGNLLRTSIWWTYWTEWYHRSSVNFISCSLLHRLLFLKLLPHVLISSSLIALLDDA